MRGNKYNQKSVAGWVEYSQNATLVFISAYAIYVFLGKIRTPHALRSGTLLLRNNDTAVDTFVSTAVSVLVEVNRRHINSRNQFFQSNSLGNTRDLENALIFDKNLFWICCVLDLLKAMEIKAFVMLVWSCFPAP